MAYNLYQVQMSDAWKQRIQKETASAEKFWIDQALGSTDPQKMHGTAHGPNDWETGSVARSNAGSKASSAAPSGFTSKTSFLKSRLDKLEAELSLEREQRLKVEQDLQLLRNNSQSLSPGTA